jgi:D-arabinose 1-dehydrogenase-like Zn-dependent alcohol dehydrogenase
MYGAAAACGVCRTDLHVVDGDLPDPKVPIIPGHEIVGRIDAIGAGVEGLSLGERVGIPWLGHTCRVCPYCMGGVSRCSWHARAGAFVVFVRQKVRSRFH